MIKFAVPFLVAFVFSLAFIFLGIRYGKKIKWTGRHSKRHIRGAGISRLGGIAIALAFIFTIALSGAVELTHELMWLLLASTAVIAAGFWDDIREISWKKQLIFQVLIASVIFFAGVKIYYVANPLTGKIIMLDSGFGLAVSFFLGVLWIILMINSMNWLDGIDGLSGGVALIGALVIFFLSLKPEVNQPSVAIISIILAGAVLGFLIFNFNPSRVLAGTSGSMFMGFALAVLAIFAGTKIATSILVMSLPLFDFVWVIGERIKNKKSIFKPDQGHLHHKLLRLGWSQKKTAFFVYAVTVFLSLVALNTRAIGKGVAFAVLVAAMVIFFKLIGGAAAGEIERQ